MQIHTVLKPDGILVFSVLNRNFAAWLSMLWHCDWQRDLPCAVLDWRLGVTPAEMKTLCNDAGLNMVHEELEGLCGTMSVSIEWGKFPWITQYQHTGTQVWCFSCAVVVAAELFFELGLRFCWDLPIASWCRLHTGCLCRLRCRLFVVKHTRMQACKDISKRYMGWAYKHPAPEDPGRESSFEAYADGEL